MAAFWNCSKLTSASIPGSVTSIDNQAFGSTGLTAIEIEADGDITLSNGSFSQTSAVKKVSIGSNSGTVTLDDALAAGAVGQVRLFGKIDIKQSYTFQNATCTQYDLSGVTELTKNGGSNPFYYWRQNKTPTVYVASETVRDVVRATDTNSNNTTGMIFAVTNGGTFADTTIFTDGTLAGPEKLGARFVGWYTKDGTDGDWGEEVTTPVVGSTYYAKWVEHASTITTDIDKVNFVVGEPSEFTLKITSSEEDKDTSVVGLVGFTGLESTDDVKIEVLSVTGSNGNTLAVDPTSQNGFAMQDATIKLCATFMSKGSYQFAVAVRNKETLAELCKTGPVSFTVSEKAEVPDDSTSSSGADDGAAAAAVILGGAAIGAVTYAVGTQIWMETHLPDGVIPTSREQLALMLWNAAGRPQPAGAALYADISAEAADTQLAARWCVEQGLMKDYGESFKPGKYTFRWQVIKAWNRVQKMN